MYSIGSGNNYNSNNDNNDCTVLVKESHRWLLLLQMLLVIDTPISIYPMNTPSQYIPRMQPHNTPYDTTLSINSPLPPPYSLLQFITNEYSRLLMTIATQLSNPLPMYPPPSLPLCPSTPLLFHPSASVPLYSCNSQPLDPSTSYPLSPSFPVP